MGHKAAATGIVAAIAAIAGGFLYSPVTSPAPSVRAVSASLPPPLQAAPAAEVVTLAVAAPAQGSHRLASTALVSFTSAPQPALPSFAPRAESPAGLPPLAAADAPIVSGAPLPAVVGRVPSSHESTTGTGGAIRAAGQSLGAALATTGRGIRGAFRHAF